MNNIQTIQSKKKCCCNFIKILLTVPAPLLILSGFFFLKYTCEIFPSKISECCCNGIGFYVCTLVPLINSFFVSIYIFKTIFNIKSKLWEKICSCLYKTAMLIFRQGKTNSKHLFEMNILKILTLTSTFCCLMIFVKFDLCMNAEGVLLLFSGAMITFLIAFISLLILKKKILKEKSFIHLPPSIIISEQRKNSTCAPEGINYNEIAEETV